MTKNFDQLSHDEREAEIAKTRANLLYRWNAREHLRREGRKRVKKWRKDHPAEARLVAQVNNANRWAKQRGDGNRISVAVWKFIRSLRGGACFCCGQARTLEVEHVVPGARGGLNRPENIQALCHPCNASKRCKSTDYRTDDERAAILKRFGAPTAEKVIA